MSTDDPFEIPEETPGIDPDFFGGGDQQEDADSAPANEPAHEFDGIDPAFVSGSSSDDTELFEPVPKAEREPKLPINPDEDLFDFPALTAEQTEAARNQDNATEEVMAAIGKSEPGPQPAANTPEPVHSQPVASMPEPSQAQPIANSPEPAQTQPVASASDSERNPGQVPPQPIALAEGTDLDEDLFHFDDLFKDLEVDEATIGHADFFTLATSEPEPLIDTAPIDAGFDAPAPVRAESPLTKPSSSLPSFDDADANAAFFPNLDDIEAEADRQTAETIGPALVTNGRREKVFGALTVLVILVNVALIFFAWRASTSFESTLTGLRSDLADSLGSIELPDDLLERFATQTVEAGPKTDPEPVEDEIVIPQAPSPFENYEELEIDSAREELERGAYPSARRRLYRMLANCDRVPVDDETLARAEFMIATSYYLEGKEIEQ